MKKILLNGVDGNFGSRAADVLLEKWPHEDLIFTAPTEDGTKRYADSDVELRVANYNDPELLTIGEYLAIASEVTGKKVTYEYIDDDALYAFFDSIGVPRTTEGMWADSAQNFPFCSDGMVSFGRAIRLGQMSTFTNDFEELVGRKPITVREIFEHMDEHLIGARTSTEG